MDFNSIPTPFYYVDEGLVTKNLKILQSVIHKTGCKILLAQKAFSMYALYPLISQYLHGTTASGLYEAKLGHEEFGGETHVFSPAYAQDDFTQIIQICDYIVFNSFTQSEKFKHQALSAGRKCGIRINPEHSTGSHAIYDPCAPGSRLGTTRKNFHPALLSGITGLHFHTLCQQNSDALVETVHAAEEKFGNFLHQMDWLNIGGGHHITRADYDIDALVNCVNHLQQTYNLTVYIEPGEAVVLNTGFLVATVLEIIDNGIQVAILDTSAACHMPDVLEMPYRPEIIHAGSPGERPHQYRLAGPTCLAGDIIGDYTFDATLSIGQRLIFCDMAHYSMVKNNTFNGMPLPSIAIKNASGDYRVVKKFTYDDFKNRL